MKRSLALLLTLRQFLLHVTDGDAYPSVLLTGSPASASSHCTSGSTLIADLDCSTSVLHARSATTPIRCMYCKHTLEHTMHLTLLSMGMRDPNGNQVPARGTQRRTPLTLMISDIWKSSKKAVEQSHNGTPQCSHATNRFCNAFYTYFRLVPSITVS